ncbi:MAG: V-type ATP synthase subunit E [Candidatus Krumholzibacteriota bacterium]|nr:V-type ATP synthase subunit E [Candidatus Krumholzibacteriota bacterium]
MSIENIINKIDEETDQAVRDILDEGRSRAGQIKEEYLARAGRLAAELREQAEKKARDEEKRLIVSAQLEMRKETLGKKRELLDGLYREAKSRIGTISSDDYREIIKTLIQRKAISGREEIVVGSAQADLFTDDFIESIRSGFPGGGQFSLAAEPGSFTWGVVLREGRRLIDLSLEVILEQLREDIESRLAAFLFRSEQ